MVEKEGIPDPLVVNIALLVVDKPVIALVLLAYKNEFAVIVDGYVAVDHVSVPDVLVDINIKLAVVVDGIPAVGVDHIPFPAQYVLELAPVPEFKLLVKTCTAAGKLVAKDGIPNAPVTNIALLLVDKPEMTLVLLAYKNELAVMVDG